MDAGARLLELGLSAKETAVYLALVQEGAASAGRLAEKTGVNRRSCYDALFSLQEKGLVNAGAASGGRRRFVAAGLDAFRARLREKEALLDELDAALLARKRPPEEPQVEVYRGAKAIKGVFEGLLRDGRTIYIYGGYNPAKADLKYYYPKFTLLREKRGVRVRAMHIDVPGMREIVRTLPLWEARFLDERTISPSFWWLQGDRVYLIFWKEEPVIMGVTDKSLAKTHLHSFRMLWKSARR